MNRRRLITSILLLFSCYMVQAQKGIEDGSKYGKGQDSIRALQNLSMYQQYYKQNAFMEAVAPWRVVFSEAPRASQNMYIHGITIYKTMFNATTDLERRKEIVDTIMLIYDRRIEYFNRKGELLVRKAIDLRELDESRLTEVYEFLTEAINVDQDNVLDIGINVYMQVSLSLYLKEEISRDEMIANYIKSIDILEHQLKKAKGDDKKKESINQIIDNVQLIFSNSGAADCETLLPVLSRKYDQAPDDVENLEAILNLLRVVKCEDSDLFANAAEKLNKLAPSANSAYNLGKYFLVKKDYNKTITYYNQAISLEEDDSNKAKYYSELAVIMLVADKSPAETRNVANQAIRLNPNDGRSYITIGRLYASHNKSISDNDFEQTSAYWAAVDKFIQAKRVDPSVAEEADKLISTYSAYFPSQETIFFNDIKEGEDYRVPGWINESTKVRIRK